MRLSPYEIKQIESLLNPKLTAADILDKEELNYVTRHRHHGRIRDFIFVPTHSRSNATYRVQKIITESFDFANFVETVIDEFSGKFEIAIDLGYFAMKPIDNDSLHFIYPSKLNAFMTAMITTPEKYDIFLEELKEVNSDFLMYAFEQHQKDKAFYESGYVPRTPVVLDMFITTFD